MVEVYIMEEKEEQVVAAGMVEMHPVVVKSILLHMEVVALDTLED